MVWQVRSGARASNAACSAVGVRERSRDGLTLPHREHLIVYAKCTIFVSAMHIRARNRAVTVATTVADTLRDTCSANLRGLTLS